MMVEMSRICDQYGLDVWIWYPAMDKDYSDPATVEFALKEWGEVYPPAAAHRRRVRARRRSRPHAAEVPVGAAGKADRSCCTNTIRRRRCGCRRRASARTWMDEFYGIMKSGAGLAGRRRLRPAGARSRLPDAARARPEEISDPPLSRHHAQPAGQYPVPDWDVAYAVTEGREVINPRPTQDGRHFPPLHGSIGDRLPDLLGRLSTTTSTSSSGAAWAGIRMRR